MRSGKLSKRDAVDLLDSQLLWALEKLELFNPGPYVDTLISRLIIKLGQPEEFENKQRLMNWMVRAIPYEEDPLIIQTYLTFLFAHQYADRYLLLIDHYRSERITEQVAKELLALQPNESYQILQDYQRTRLLAGMV